MDSVVSVILFLAVLFLLVLWAADHLRYLRKELYCTDKAKDLKFLQIKMPRTESDMDKSNDAIQSMKQNIEVMNQILKNAYAISGSSRKEKNLAQTYISCEILIENEVIKYIIAAPTDYTETFEKMISSFYPGAVIDPIPQPKLLDAGKFAAGGYFTLAKKSAYPLKTYETFEVDPMDSILAAFSRVETDEKLCLQLLLAPIGDEDQKNLKKEAEQIKTGKTESIRSFLKDIVPKKKEEEKPAAPTSKLSSQQLNDVERKSEDEGFRILMRGVAVSPDPKRPEKMMSDLERSLHQYAYVGLNAIKYASAKHLESFLQAFVQRIFMRAYNAGRDGLLRKRAQYLNIKEVSSLYHFPHIRFNKNPRIKRQNFKIVPAPDNLPTSGVLLGTNTFGGVKRMVYLSDMDRFRHFYCIGQTGTGKSTTLLAMARQDMDQGRGFTLIDPHGDLCEDLIRYFPKERIDDLIYRDAGNMELPYGFNFLTARNEREMDLITNDAVDMFIKLYGPEIFGPRIQDYFRNGVLTLMEQPDGGTLVEIMRLFTDAAYQKIKVKNVKNPVVRARWEKTFASMGEKEKSEMIPYFQAKFGPLTTTPILRNIIGQVESSFEIANVMDTNKILLMNLSKGKMGDINANLLGMMIVSQLRIAAFRRADIPEKDRVPHYLYIDEFQNFVTPAIESILSEARKYRLSLNIAHQYVKQLEQGQGHAHADMKGPIFGNIGNFLFMRVGPEDAEFLSGGLAPYFSKTDLVNIDKYKGVVRLVVDSQPTKPFTLSVRNPFADPAKNIPEKTEVIKQISALKYGRKKDLVEKELFYRVGA